MLKNRFPFAEINHRPCLSDKGHLADLSRKKMALLAGIIKLWIYNCDPLFDVGREIKTFKALFIDFARMSFVE